MKTQTILFDLDGTVADSIPVILETSRLGCLDLGIPWDENRVKGLIGLPLLDTGELLPMLTGEMVRAEVLGITKSQAGTTGELKGRFTGQEKIAALLENCGKGVYGLCESGYQSNNQPVTVAMRQQVKTGDAQILSTVDGTVRAYDIKIVSVRLKDDDALQNMVIEVTDPDLLELTGGIVQGMSGSPIMQEGKIIGAVTHVFVNDPTRGYGIFIEWMLKQAKERE